MNTQQIKKQISKKLVEKYKDVIFDPCLTHSQDYAYIKKQSNLPWMQLPIKIPVEQIHKEILEIEHFFVSHRDQYSEHCGWKSFCIHGKSYDSTREDKFYDDDIPYKFTTEAEKLMPQTVKFFQSSFPFTSYQRVRVMLLEPGGYITVHKDSDNPGLSPINIAITQPDRCYFVMDKFGKVPFDVGSCMWLDVSNMHTVFNDSDLPRYHIIVHGNPDEGFKNLVVKQYNELYNKQI